MRHSNVIVLTLATILPACIFQQVSYEQDIAPILARNCNGCHMAPGGYGYKVIGLKTDSYDSIIQGTVYGPVVVAGDSRRSILNKLVEARVCKNQGYSHNFKEGISNEEIKILRIWVDQGALNN